MEQTNVHEEILIVSYTLYACQNELLLYVRDCVFDCRLFAMEMNLEQRVHGL